MWNVCRCVCVGVCVGMCVSVCVSVCVMSQGSNCFVCRHLNLSLLKQSNQLLWRWKVKG